MQLATTIYGEGAPLVIAHGLYGSGRNWGVIGKRLADERKVIAVDMRNHGESPWSDDHSYTAMAEDLAKIAPRPFDIVGHSMGGKAAMTLALTHPGAVGRLIVVDIAPTAYEHTQAPLIDAMRRTDLSGIKRRAEAELDVEDPGVRAFLLQSLDVAEKRWRLNLDALDNNMSEIVGWPEPEGRFDGPALFLRGGNSGYVRDRHIPEIRRLFPAAEIQTIDDAGHWLHAERPREVEAAIRAFLSD